MISCGGYADEAQTAATIRDLYDKCGYIIDTHTAVAVAVYRQYLEQTGDQTRTVIASTASPFKFTRSVMDAIDREKYDGMSDFDLADELSRIGNVAVPKAISEIRTAPVVHDHVCEKEEMPDQIRTYLGI